MKNTKSKGQESSAGLSRRQVLRGSSALAGIGILGGRSSAQQKAHINGGSGAGDAVLVQIFLRGAMDGLTTVVPHGDPDYYANRPTLAIPQPGQTNGALDLDGFFGLAPSAAPLLTPYSNGHLAIVHAAGSTDPTRSHFDAFARMEFGSPNLLPGAVTDGWLSRFLIERAGQATGVLRAVGSGDILPLTLAGAPNTLPIANMSNFLFPGNPLSAQERSDLLAQMYGNERPPVGPAAINTFDSIDLISDIDFAGYVPAGGAQYPATTLGRELRDTAALIKARKGVEAITIDYGGWDLHASLGPLTGTMAAMLDELTRAIEAFYLDMFSMIDEVVLVCLSEFGRRVGENSSAGVDHGHGNAMLALGGGINGGQVIANWPGLAPAQLDQGDLAITIDYRDILGEILTTQLGATNLAPVFPQHSFTTHGITV